MSVRSSLATITTGCPHEQNSKRQFALKPNVYSLNTLTEVARVIFVSSIYRDVVKPSSFGYSLPI